ncbi:MAG: hypothetical protein M1812_000745 [Candelaria pacifica]|nr:MAG: hypothetical protein M1812_000745 [Candelaria pacifica]
METSSRSTSQRSKTEKSDESIMLTNNSSIVSKRSVERLYYPDEPHFFRHFVKKPQRRSPLINRGYWLRMKAIDHVVHGFLDEPSHKKRVVINLGCGYDPLPFQCLSKYAHACHNVLFIDVDYKQLMARKCEVVWQTAELYELLTSATRASDQDVLLRSDRYLAVGCDLKDLGALDRILAQELDMTSCIILCTAEVSITYMDVEAADAVIAWASQIHDARFCLLEQFLPAGSGHPFAKTMIRHFDKLQTPLKSIHKYKSATDQQARFRKAGWSVPFVKSLWELWSSPSFLTPDDRSALDSIEPFDEWEEFALFASHYFLLVAETCRGIKDNQEAIDHDIDHLRRNIGTLECSPITDPGINALANGRLNHGSTNRVFAASADDQGAEAGTQPHLHLRYYENPKGQGCRRFGAGLPIGTRAVGHHGGLGLQTRLSSTDKYSSHDLEIDNSGFVPTTLRPRMCHTITRLNNSDCLLVGGRSSPDSPLADCWLRKGHEWQRVEDLPVPRYRHCAAQLQTVDGVSAVLVFGGKGPVGKVLDDWLLWANHRGWKKLLVVGHEPISSFGASMISISDVEGILCGGMTQDGTVRGGCWYWAIEGPEFDTVRCQRLSLDSHSRIDSDRYSERFGASLVPTNQGTFLIGGIGGKGVLTQDEEIIDINLDFPHLYLSKVESITMGPRPLLIGCTVPNHCGNAHILGGGAVCFSFGAHHNQGIWVLEDPQSTVGSSLRLVEKPIASSTTRQASSSQSGEENCIHPQYRSVTSAISRLQLESAEQFSRVLQEGRPVIFEGLQIGTCTEKWTPEYMKEQVGIDRQVVVHSATTKHMNFQAKNFVYNTMGFGEFVNLAANGNRLYLRSLALDKPSERPVELAHDFPTIAGDFKLPAALAFVTENAHSSPLRISGSVSMWLHYDVMANVLCQIRGTKRLLVYPPTDINHLHIPPGASSSSINIFKGQDSRLPCISEAQPFEATLEPGDVLFIPALWPHAASPTDGLSVAVNVFFRHLRSGYAPGKDVYGNRDLQAYEKGRRDIDKVVRAFDGLPSETARFYLERLAAELGERAKNT